MSKLSTPAEICVFVCDHVCTCVYVPTEAEVDVLCPPQIVLPYFFLESHFICFVYACAHIWGGTLMGHGMHVEVRGPPEGVVFIFPSIM